MLFSKLKKLIVLVLFFNLFSVGALKSEIIKEIIINGNDRISDETIIMFSKISVNDNIKKKKIE